MFSTMVEVEYNTSVTANTLQFALNRRNTSDASNEFWFENVKGNRHCGCRQVNNIEMDIWENGVSRQETDY